MRCLANSSLSKQASLPEAFLTRGPEAILLPYCINSIFMR
jgi:hypothetical protein